MVEQVGGTHYQAEVGHWDVMERHDVAYLEGNATKYVTRWRKKGQPTEDLEKAISYLDRVLQERRGVRRSVPAADLALFFHANDLPTADRLVIKAVLGVGYGTLHDVREARHKLQLMLDELEKAR